MNENNNEHVQVLLKSMGLENQKITPFQTNARVEDYLINEEDFLRISKQELDEVTRLKSVIGVSFAQQLKQYHVETINETTYYCALLSFLKGVDFYDAILALESQKRLHIADQVLHFMDDMHQIQSNQYDIGFYVPTIGKFEGTWKEGHFQYFNWLKRHIENQNLDETSKDIIENAFEYIKKNLNVLEYQTGPVLLHNDLHPKNIIVSEQQLSGVIDFECSQFGERDFELVHFIHWSVFPPDNASTFDDYVIHIIKEFQKKHNVPSLDKRLTLYQLEHELNQLIWNPNKGLQERLYRINIWLQDEITKRYF